MAPRGETSDCVYESDALLDLLRKCTPLDATTIFAVTFSFTLPIFTLRRKSALETARVTHVLSALDGPISADLVQGYRHLQINIQDVEDENILEHFPKAIAFIREGLEDDVDAEKADRQERGHGVIVHCAMGKSRSATLIIAFLLHATHHLPLSASTFPPSSSSPTSSQDDSTFLHSSSSYQPNTQFTPSSALALLRECRPLAEPNSGFMNQLILYHRMGCPDTASQLDEHPEYQRWLYRRHVDECIAADQAPNLEKVRFEDEHERAFHREEDLIKGRGKGSAYEQADELSKGQEFRCRKCRTTLATEEFVLEHVPKSSNRRRKKDMKENTKGNDPTSQQQPCAHIFVSPLSWMRPFLSASTASPTPQVIFSNDSSESGISEGGEPGPLSGRLLCPSPRCRETNVGKFAWAGMACSCGEWMTPAFSLARKSIDIVNASTSVRAARGDRIDGQGKGRSDDRKGIDRGMEIRMPPSSGYGKGKM